MVQPVPNDIVEKQLDQRLVELENEVEADILCFVGPIQYTIDDFIRDAIEEIPDRKGKLSLVLETTGGYIEVAKRIVTVLRKHYGVVDFIVPNFAMSAGTVLVMSGNDILMDYYSILGPIDPQVESQRTHALVPALGYLEYYRRLIEKSRRGKLTTAELNYLVERFDPAELYRYEQARELSVALLVDWLTRYKFKNWKETETRHVKVTEAMKRRAAKGVATILNKSETWHSHSVGISREVLEKRVGLKTTDFGANEPLNRCIREYYKTLTGYMLVRNRQAVIHTRRRLHLLGGE
jgi:hypothetical protein